MFKLKMVGLLAVLAIPASAMAAPNCEAPAKPDLPQNGAVLSAIELDAAAEQVSSYSKASKAYHACLDEVIASPAKYTRDEWRAALKAYNASAPGMEEVWSSYQKLSEDWVSAHLAKTKTASQ